MVSFADKLHVSVFDTVVYHFNEMSGAIFADPVATWFVVDLSGDTLRNKIFMVTM